MTLKSAPRSGRSAVLVAAGLLGSVLLGGSTVSYYEESLPTTMNPLFARTMVDFRSHELIFDRMVFRSAINNELRSRVLVENAQAPYVKMERLEAGVAVKLWVKEGVKWHDGEKFGPDDVCFTINAMIDETTPSPIAKSFRESIASCEPVKGENAVLIRFKKAFHQPLEHLQFSVLPKHSFQGTSISPDLDFSSRPIGTGPMKGAKGRKEVKFEAFANAHHSPKIDILSLNEGGDPFVQVRTLLSGGVHGVISVAPPLRPDVAAADDVALKSYDLRSWWFVAVNSTKGALKDKRVRQALNMTIDRNELRELTIGVDPNDDNPPCEFISGPFVQSSPYYNRQIKSVEKSDRATARTLMTASGATENAGRWMWTDGQPITLKIGMNAPLDAEAKDLLNQVGNQFQAGGFDRTVYKITQDDWARKAVTGQMTDFDLLIGKWSFGQVEDVNPLFHSRSKDGQGALNIFNYNSPAVDATLGKFDAAKTDTEARDSYHELHAMMADELPYLFLWKLDTKSAWRNEIRNNTISPYYYFTEFDGWRFEGAAVPASP